MRYVVGLLFVASCAARPAPPPAQVRTPPPAPAAPKRQGVGYGELTPDVVLATIRSRYIGGVERCYRRQLKKDATVRGRVLVSFAVDPKGRAFDGEARGITAAVNDCIAAQVSKWQFPRPADEVRFALGLELGAN